MDKNTLAVLQDYQTSIDKAFNKIDKKISTFSQGDKNKKKSDLSFLKQELANIKANLSLMKSELSELEGEGNKTMWGETVSKLKSKVKNYSEKIKELEEEQDKNGNNRSDSLDYMNPDEHPNLDNLNVKQVMERGDNILDEDDKAIKNMANVVNQDVEQMKNVNVELNRQQEKLENVDSDLKEMDYSLKRAGKQITSMFKMYSSDKCITCMIVVILVIIVTIIIVSACGGDNKNNFNVPHDIFSKNNKTSNSSQYLKSSFDLLYIIYFILIIFL